MEKTERTIVVGIYNRREQRRKAEETLAELEELVRSAGGEVVGRVLHRRPRYDPAYLVGKGKIVEIAAMAEELDADLVVFDESLSPAQHRNIEKMVDTKVLDRTQLILDIFAQRAMTREGKLQVELAQLTYLLPRLTGKGREMSRLGGGIGTRGPGEKKLEYDRRRINERIKRIKREISDVRKRREVQRKHRKKENIPTVALVGYTSAGKTTLFNLLTGADKKISRALFTTLDPVLRRVTLPSGFPVLLSDTVGFIRKLPVELVTAFRATLEETIEADVLLHVVDVSSEHYREEIEAVEKTLQDLDAMDKPIIKVFNKIDLLPRKDYFLLKNRDNNSEVYISARTGEGVEDLLNKIEGVIMSGFEIKTIFIPFSKQSDLEEIKKRGIILSREVLEEGIKIKVGKKK